MALTTAQAFAAFLATISPTDNQKLEISAKRDSTEGYLRAAFPQSSDLPLKRVILIGSADRGTIVRPIEDVDVMAEFTNKAGVFERYRQDSASFLQRIRQGLVGATSLSQIGARGQAVRLFYQSGAYVDIAPTFKWSSAGYGLPSGSGDWLTTDPEAQAVWYSGRRAAVGADLSDVVKLARRWNAIHSSSLHSYHLEVMTASMFKSVGSNHRDALRCFFERAPGWVAVSDPAGHSGRLDDYLGTSARTAVLSRFSSAASRAQQALAAEARGDHSEAKRLWRIELGDEFPTY